VKDSELLKLNADTLAVLGRVSPAPAPVREGWQPPAGDDGRPGLYAVYGVGIDDAKDTVWVTNTRQNTVAVYKQSDLSLIKQFPPETVPHSRDVVVDQKLGKAYASAVGSTDLIAIDTNTLEVAKKIPLRSLVRGEDFSAASLSLDANAHRLYVAGLSTNEVAVIDTRTDEVVNVFPVPGSDGSIGISHDPQTGRIFVTAQGSDNLVILDGATGAVVADTPVGAGSLNVVFDPVKRLAYVANRGAGTVTVTDVDGRIVANLGPSPLANHVSLGKNGVVYAVDKSAGANSTENDVIQRIAPRK
jgi:DNA-binding beta-propeller fold protein YncE